MQTLTKTLTGAQAIIQTLNSLNIDTIFGYPGGVVLSVYDELAKQDTIKHYLVRHEQSAVHCAEGYARVTGKCGAVVVTSGPGATNVVTGLANAYLDGFPLLVITGQVSAELLHQDAFQEVDIIDITKSCTKKNFQVKSIETLQDTLIAAYNTAMTGKKGPVVVDITKNVFSQTAEFETLKSNTIQTFDNEFDLQKAIDAISSSQRPVIITGGGAIDASVEVQEFAKKLNIPVVSTMMGLGVYPANDENYLGMVGIFGNANKIVRESDLIIAIGSRFNDRIKNCLGNDIEQKLIHIDIEKTLPQSIGLIGDAKAILSELISSTFAVHNFEKWIEHCKTLNAYSFKKRSDRLHSFEVLEEIQKYFSGQDPIIATEVGQHQVWTSRCLQFKSPRKFITSGGLGTMGFGFPASIGACVGANNQPVICLAGDGSFQMSIQEIATCVDYNLPVKVFIFNNGYLGMVRQFQEKSCEQRYFATKISNPDFVKLAQSYGALGLRVEKKEAIKPALEKTMNHNGIVLVDFVIEPEEIL